MHQNNPLRSKQLLYQIELHPPSSSSDQRLGEKEIFELPHYQVRSKQPSDPQSLNKVLTFATINKVNKIEIVEQGLHFISSYAKFQLIFCGVYGPKKSGKSTLIDKILRIGSQNEKGFEQIGKYSPNRCLRINRKPLSLGNKRIFFIEMSLAYSSSKLPQQQQKLLDIMIMISNSLFVMLDRENTLAQVTNHISNSAKRLGVTNRSFTYWPENIYAINTYHNFRLQTQFLDQLFTKNSEIIWSKNQKKCIESILLDLSQDSKVKMFGDLEINSYVLDKLLIKLQQEENIIQDSESVRLTLIFDQITEELQQQYLKYHTDMYDNTIQTYFLQQKPYQIDYMIQAFTQSRQKVTEHYFTYSITKDLNLTYFYKLQQQFDQKQRLLIEVNKKKSQFELKKELNQQFLSKNNLNTYEDILQTTERLKLLHCQYRQNGIEMISKKLLELLKATSNRGQKLTKRSQKDKYLHIQQLKQSLDAAKDTYKTMKTSQSAKQAEKNKNSYQLLREQQQQLSSRREQLKREIEQLKKSNKQRLQEKKITQEKTDKILVQIRQLEQKQRQNQRLKKDVIAQYDFNPQIQRLERQIEKIQRKINGQNSKLDSVINNFIDQNVKAQPQMLIK